jgi:hypothetical protein
MKLSSLLALALLTPIGFALALGVHVEPDENNVTQDRLEGVWVVDAELRERMGVKVDDVEVEFIADDSFLADIPAKYDAFLKEKQVFEAGRVVWRKNGRPSSYPYLLTTHAGNPHLITFREKDGDPFGDGESCNLVVVPAKESKDDLLFVGGDFDNESFRAFHRKPTTSKK